MSRGDLRQPPLRIGTAGFDPTATSVSEWRGRNTADRRESERPETACFESGRRDLIRLPRAQASGEDEIRRTDEKASGQRPLASSRDGGI